MDNENQNDKTLNKECSLIKTIDEEELKDLQETGIKDDNDTKTNRDLDENYDIFDDHIEDRSKDLNCIQRFFAPIKAGSLRGSIFSLASICFDTTSLSFPLALTKMGLVPGSIALFIMALLSYWSLTILLHAGRRRKIMNYRDVIKECLGEKMVLLSDINNVIFSVGAQTAYIVTISRFFLESLHSLYGIEESQNIKIIQMACSMVFLQIPLSLMKNISKLQYLSMLGSFVLIFTLVVMCIESVFYYQLGIKEGRTVDLYNPPNWSYLDTFSVFLFGFAPHNGMFLIYSEMKKPTLRRTTKVLNRAMILQSVIFIIIAYSGYLSLIKDVPSIFLSRPPLPDMDRKDYLIISSKILFFFSLHGLCAINFNLLRGTISGFFFKGNETTFFQNFYVTVIMFISSNLLAFFSDNVVTIIGIISGVSVTFICYVFPILCYVTTNNHSLCHVKNIFSLGIMIIVCVLGLMSTVKGFVENIIVGN